MSAFHSRNLAALILLSFVSVILLCTWSASTMSMDKPISDCLPNENSLFLCSTAPQGHISVWQNSLNTISQKTPNLLLLVLLLVFVSATYNKSIWPRAPEIIQRVFLKARRALDIIDPIKQALTCGITQPQIYNSVLG